MKGVSTNFVEQQRIPKEGIVEGELLLKDGEVNYAIIGRGIQNTLSVAIADHMFPLQVYYIKNVKAGSDPSSMYSKKNILPAGVFSIIQNLDDNYMVVPLSFAKELLNYGDKRTALEVKIKAGENVYQIEAAIQKVLGETFNVLNPDEQHKDIYRIIKMEKLFTFLAFTILLGIGAINIFFSLMMLVLDKKKDISVLYALGANQKTVRNIFLTEGLLIGLLGTLTGLALGAFFCFIQLKFGVISMGMESAVTPGYPVKMLWTDFVATLLVVFGITFLISFRPAALAAKSVSITHL